MAKIQKNFIKGRMNKSIDERLVPQGEYIDALNVRLGSTETQEIGAVENSKGNELLVELEFLGSPLSVDARCIGAFEDGANETIYWFVHDKSNTLSSTGKVDMIVSYDTRNSVLFYHVISTSVLNFNEDYLVNGINLIDELLFFTDNLNPPRKINIKRVYLKPNGSTVDQITEDDISVIVKPPLKAPTLQQFKVGGGENYMEEILLSFAYRWQYEDGEYSALSPFSEYAFTPGPYNFNYRTFGQEGMRNSFNSVNVNFNTGSKNVKNLDVVFKFSTSTSVNVIERFNKLNEGWVDNSEQNITFTNKKVFTALPEEQLLRLYDNVPLKAQAQTIMGNRLMYGNYVDGYNIEKEDGTPVHLDYELELISESLENGEITGTLSSNTYTIDTSVSIDNCKVSIDFGGLDLKEGSQVGVNFNYTSSAYGGDSSYDDGSQPENIFQYTFLFQLQKDYSSVYELSISDEFIEAVSSFVPLVDNQCVFGGGTEQGTSLTDTYVCSVQSKSGWEFIGFGLSLSPQGFGIESSQGSDEITFVIPALVFEEYDQTQNPPTPTGTYAYEYLSAINAEGLYAEQASKTSLHSNRDYEVAIVYMDEYGRSTTALVDTENTVFVPCDKSVNKNNIRVKLNSYPPYWASKYKFVIKESKGIYRTVYSNIFFQEEETGDIHYLLQGVNKDKVAENDTLYVKTDTNGPVINCASTKVLEVKSQSKDFLCEKNADGDVISGTCGQPSGIYMKVKANNFAANKPPDSFLDRQSDGTYGSYPFQYVNCSIEDIDNAGDKIPFTVPAGSIINLKISSNRRHRGSSCGSRSYLYEKKFVSSQDYDSLYAWVQGDNIDLTNGVFEGTDDTINTITQYNDIKSYPSYLASGGKSFIGFQSNGTPGNWGTNDLYLVYQTGTPKCGSPNKRNAYADINFQIERANSITVFETEPLVANDELYYENEQTFDIVDGFHLSGEKDDDQNQTISQPAIVDLNFFNCYTFGNGVESSSVLDGLTKPMVELGEKVTSVSEEQYKQVHRFSDVTYSGVFNQETNLNKLNQFNLALSNFKTLEGSYGPIRKMHSRQTDILTLQEDKISYLLVGKNLLSDAAAGGAVTSVPEVLGTQLARIEEYGISNNPESFSSYGYDVFFTDAKRSSVIQLKGGSAKSDQLAVISQAGMRSWFRDLFATSFETQKLGGYDPYMNEYVLSSNAKLLPKPLPQFNCGYEYNTSSLSTEHKLLIDLSTIIGNVTFNYNVVGNLNIEVEWNGTSVVNEDVSNSGTVTFNKSNNNPSIATVTLTPISTNPSVVVDFNCPESNQLTVKEIVINYSGDVSLTTTTDYSWSINDSSSSDSSNVVTLKESGVSLFRETTGTSSFGVIPAVGSTVLIKNKQGAGQTFEFDPSSDKFKYLTTNTNYNEEDLATLLPLLNTATPIVGGSGEYQSSFTYSTQSDYIYIVWDFREPTLLEFCYDATSPVDACCECS